MIVVNFSTAQYSRGQQRLARSLGDRPKLMFSSYEAIGSPTHSESPYEFKIHAIEKGFEQDDIVLWVDSSMYLVGDLTIIENHRMLSAAAMWHPGFIETFDKILAAIGVKRAGDVKVPIYQNHFSSRREIYQDYVKNYLIPAMDAITNDKEINALAMQDSKYSDLTHQSADHLKEKLGISYYPLVPFLLERLFSVYVHNNKIRVTHL